MILVKCFLARPIFKNSSRTQRACKRFANADAPYIFFYTYFRQLFSEQTIGTNWQRVDHFAKLARFYVEMTFGPTCQFLREVFFLHKP